MSFRRIITMPVYGIGDMLMATPAIRNIKERLGATVVCLHMFGSTRDVLTGNPHVDENHLFQFLSKPKMEGVRFLLKLRGRGFDASLNFYPSNRRDYNLSAMLVGAPIRIGHRYALRDIRELNFLKNRTLREDDSLHNVQENLRLLRFLGIERPEPYPLEIYLSDEERAWATGWADGRGLGGTVVFGFHPGSSLFKEHAKKRWPKEKYAALIRELSVAVGDAAFLLFGGPEEDQLKQEIISMAALGNGRVIAVSTASIRQSAALMGLCRVFVTNDSGLMHLAAAMAVPTVALFGPTNPQWLSPWRTPSRVLRMPGCPPCFRYSPIPQHCHRGEDFACLAAMEVSTVLSAAMELLEGGSKKMSGGA